MARTLITCECGNKVEVNEPSEKETFVVFCEDCYLNSIYQKSEEGYRLSMRYYFPDD